MNKVDYFKFIKKILFYIIIFVIGMILGEMSR